MAASDLATLADTKAWLAGSSGIGSSDDALLARLITDVSGAITAYLGRPSLAPRLVVERGDGNGAARIVLRHYPVLEVTSLVIDNVAVAAATPPAAGAPHASGYLLESWDGLPPGRPQSLDVFGTFYRQGRQNVVIIYNAGYAVANESATVPAGAGPYTVTAAAPFGPWASNGGVTYANGPALTAVANSPADGEYTVADGAYTFAAADGGADVIIRYGFIPAAINNACIEWVAERYRYRTRVGQSAQTVQGQQTASYSLKDIPDFIRASLDPYRSVVAV
jgi:hypothetical protein